MLSCLSGCFSQSYQALETRQPRMKPVRNITNMETALSCMDSLLAKSKLPPVYVTSTGLPDRSSDKTIVNSGMEMLTEAISTLSRTSNVFRFIDFTVVAPATPVSNPNQKNSDHGLLDSKNLLTWVSGIGKTEVIVNHPDWTIEGSISQIDDSVISENRGVSLSFSGVDFGLSADHVSSVISLDLRLVNYDTLQMRNGSAISNSIAVMRSGVAADIGARISSKAGVYIDVSNDNNESGGHAVRTLVQYSVLKLLGEFTGLPYQTCLLNDKQSTYENLVKETKTVPAIQPLRLTINTSRGNRGPIFLPNESVDFSVTVNQDAEVNCFINDAQGRIRPVFPNLSQPNARLARSQTLVFSKTTSNLDYRFDTAGEIGEIVCLASTKKLKSPWPLNRDVKQAQPMPVSNVKNLETGYRQKTADEVKFETITLQIGTQPI